MVKKLEIDHNEKGEIVSPSYVDIVSKINEIIEIISIEKVDKKIYVNFKINYAECGIWTRDLQLGKLTSCQSGLTPHNSSFEISII